MKRDKRSKEQNKKVKQMIAHLDAMLGEVDTGIFLAMICDLLDKFVDGVEQREMRTLELRLNDYFSVKFDFEKNCVVGA